MPRQSLRMICKSCPTLLYKLVVMMLNLFVWNSRGAASKGVAAVVREMRKQYRIDIVAILEPRVSGPQAN